MTWRLAAALLVLAASAQADTLTLRDGTAVTGSWVGIDARQVSFLVNDQIRTFPRTDVLKVTFGSEPASASPKKPEAGMTTSEVVAILGQPDAIAEAGSKQIYSYKTAKVTFVDGKVTDVQ